MPAAGISSKLTSCTPSLTQDAEQLCAAEGAAPYSPLTNPFGTRPAARTPQGMELGLKSLVQEAGQGGKQADAEKPEGPTGGASGSASAKGPSRLGADPAPAGDGDWTLKAGEGGEHVRSVGRQSLELAGSGLPLATNYSFPSTRHPHNPSASADPSSALHQAAASWQDDAW